MTIPCGKLKETGIQNPDGYTLQYNEYVIYNTSQIKMKYLLKVKFNFKYWSLSACTDLTELFQCYICIILYFKLLKAILLVIISILLRFVIIK